MKGTQTKRELFWKDWLEVASNHAIVYTVEKFKDISELLDKETISLGEREMLDYYTFLNTLKEKRPYLYKKYFKKFL